MTIGLIARLDDSGLGTLCWEFARHIHFDQIQVVSNGHYKVHKYRGYNFVDRLTTDIALSFETFYGLPYEGRRVLVPMYECTRPGEKADKVISPSLLDKRYYPDSEFLPIPIARDRIPFRKRTRAMVFVHNAGHGGLGGRNGTKEVLAARKLLKTQAKIVVRSQVTFDGAEVVDRENYWDGYDGDVFLFPEKFNGLSLPIQEAMSAGMPIMSTDRFPFNAYLPRELLIPCTYEKGFIARDFDSAVINPEAIAAKVDEWYNRDITEFSEYNDNLAESLSWTRLKDQWESEIRSA